MYTAVLMLFFLHGQGMSITLDPAKTAVDLAQCEEQLDRLGQRVEGMRPVLFAYYGPTINEERHCLTSDEVLNHPRLHDDQKAHIGEEA